MESILIYTFNDNMCIKLYFGRISWESTLKIVGPTDISVFKSGLIMKIDVAWDVDKAFRIKLMLPFVIIIFSNTIVPVKGHWNTYKEC